MREVDLALDFDQVEQAPTRDGYGYGLLEAAERNPRVVVLGADISSSVRVDWFRDRFPERFFNIGIAEQNQMGIAAGLASVGFIPFVTNYGVFLSGRAWDQIRTTVCYGELNVKLGGAHGGISVGADGATHQALEEIALMRCLPNMRVVVPADCLETKKATLAMAESDGPIYLRFGREKVPVITGESTPFKLGEAYCCRRGSDVALIACGSMVYEALLAARQLQEQGIQAMVVNNHSIKPIDKESLIEAAKICKAVVTAEEHQLYAGMGSAVMEVLSQHYPVPVECVGVRDRFGESGPPEVLSREFALNSDAIVLAAHKAMMRKKATGC